MFSLLELVLAVHPAPSHRSVSSPRQHIDKLRMVLPDGTFASTDMDNKTMTEDPRENSAFGRFSLGIAEVAKLPNVWDRVFTIAMRLGILQME